MSATDELRHLLSERGVEHYDGTEQTLWGYEQTGEDTGVYRFAVSEISDGFLQFYMFHITPEQAIAATLGAGTCKLPETRIDHGSIEYNGTTSWRLCSACGAEVLADPANYCPNCGRKVEG